MSQIAYRDYWKRKTLLNRQSPSFPVLNWWPGEGTSPAESWFLKKIRNTHRLLDFGAGDMKYKKKLRENGFQGQYFSYDIGIEFPYDYYSPEEITTTFDAILCMDVIEHLALEEGLKVLEFLIGRLNPGGFLVVQTPNARCIRHPDSWDMTHIHSYNAGDLWSWLSCQGLSTELRRVRFTQKNAGPFVKIKQFASAVFVSQILGADYADNILAVAQKPENPNTP